MGFMGRRVRGSVRAIPLGCVPVGLLQETGGSGTPAAAGVRGGGASCARVPGTSTQF
jgi:hypothetical protein